MSAKRLYLIDVHKESTADKMDLSGGAHSYWVWRVTASGGQGWTSTGWARWRWSAVWAARRAAKDHKMVYWV